jgi:hypothetical protein
MKRDYTIEPYKKSDRIQVLELMHDTFWSEKMMKVHSFDLDSWRWQYQENPYGHAITFLAKANGKIIGQYANVPINMKFDNRLLHSVLVIDLMVRNEFRRKGLFKMMGDACNSMLPKLGISLSIAFPSRYESEAGFLKKLGWLKVGDLKMLAKLILPKIQNKNKLSPEIKIKEIQSFPDDTDQLWRRLQPQVIIGVVRTKEYLNWRYTKKPEGDYRRFVVYRNNALVGYFVLKTMTISYVKVGLIVDLLCLRNPEIFRSVITKTEDIFRSAGAHLCAILQTQLYNDLLKKAGFIKLPTCLNPRIYSLIVKQNQPDLDFATMQNINNWYLTFGDWDAV